MAVVMMRHASPCLPPATQWRSAEGGVGAPSELEGVWRNSHCPHEHYVVEGCRVERTDARGTRYFSLRWDWNLQRWVWGIYGRLGLRWINPNVIEWVPSRACESDHARVWQWHRCGPPLPRPIGSAGSAGSATHLARAPSRERSRRCMAESAADPNSRRASRPSEGRSRRSGRVRSVRLRSRSRERRRSRSRGRNGGWGRESSWGRGETLPCGLTAMEVTSLLTREITPEDYDLLLRLDEMLPRKTAGADVVKRLPTVQLPTQAAPPASHASASASVATPCTTTTPKLRGGKCSESDSCPVCLSPLTDGGEVVALPCSHHFHRACVGTWLADYGRACPICGGRPG